MAEKVDWLLCKLIRREVYWNSAKKKHFIKKLYTKFPEHEWSKIKAFIGLGKIGITQTHVNLNCSNDAF